MVWRVVRATLGSLLLLPNVAAAQLASMRPPSEPFDAAKAPPAPNYSEPSAWVVWPGRPSNADQTPKGLEGTIAKNPDADVFFVHPTTYLQNDRWNARFDEGGATGAQLENGVLRYQTSVFNACCRIYAPRYRQTTIAAFLNPRDDSNKAYDLAYGDVVRAFDHYVANEAKGRPFILASHSQGSLHATRLLQDRIISNPALRKRLVVAYVVGASLPEQQEWTRLPICNSARQTGCIVDWNSATAFTPLALGRGLMMTYGDGDYRTVGLKRWMCVNPLTWDRKGGASATANTGALPAVGHGNPLPAMRTGVTGARCARGRLIVSITRDKRDGFADVLTKLGSYHNMDYNLFYASIRKNAIDRVKAYRAKPRS